MAFADAQTTEAQQYLYGWASLKGDLFNVWSKLWCYSFEAVPTLKSSYPASLKTLLLEIQMSSNRDL